MLYICSTFRAFLSMAEEIIHLKTIPTVYMYKIMLSHVLKYVHRYSLALHA